MKALGIALALVASCGGERVRLATTTLERPVAMGFVCADAADRLLDLSACSSATGGATLWGLVANSSRGEVALVDLFTEDLSVRTRDIDRASPGIQLLSAGREITDLAVSPGSARATPTRAVTANHGSCDLGLIDVQELLDTPATAPVVSRVIPRVGGAPLGAGPRAVAFVPGSSAQVYALFPGCGLLARLDLATGEVLDALSIPADASPTSVTDPRCPSECAGVGAGCDGADCPDSALPTDLDVADDGSLLVVSAAGASFITIVALDRDGALGYPLIVPLEGDTVTDRVRVSPQTRYGRFAYAAARDGSVRVVLLAEARECETNADPRMLVGSQDTGCVPLGTPRRPLARGPGIDLPGARLAIDVAFGSFDQPSGDLGGARYFDGVFAFVLLADGFVVVVDLEDRVYPDAIPHAIRSEIARSAGQDGLYRLPLPAVRFDSAGKWLQRDLGEDEVPEDRYPTLLDPPLGVRFGDPPRTPTGEVTLTFEGALPETERTAGLLRECGGRVCLDDPGAAFCSKAVQIGDVVELVGCTSDSQCRSGIEVCLEDPSAAVGLGGLCVCDADADPGSDRCLDRERSACRSLITGRREFRVALARTDRLEVDAFPGACLPIEARYRVRAGDAFVLRGAAVDFLHRIVADDDGTCVVDGERSPLVQSRVALAPPPCTESSAPAPNPCGARDLVRFGHPLYDLTLSRMDDRPPREPDREFTLRFVVDGPFDLMETNVQSFLPAAIEPGPDGRFYVLDQGDEIGGSGRGRMVRMSATADEIDDFLVR